MDGKKALIGMSGGVDSSVAALLMLRAGYECIGATMRLYDNDMIGLEKGHTCCSLDDVEDARSVADKLTLARMMGITGVSVWRLGNVPTYSDIPDYDAWSAILAQR